MTTIRVALRSLKKSLGFSATAVITLALGIGTVSAMFSVVNAVLLKPLAGVDTDRIVRVSEKFPGSGEWTQPRTYREWRKLPELFDAIAGEQYCNPNLTGIGEPQQLTGACVTANWFDVYRAQAMLGRTFLPDEDRLGHERVAVLDYGFWMARFGGDRSIIGRTITLDRQPYVVAGVMPKDFLPLGKGGADLYLPWVIEKNPLAGLIVTARLSSGVTMERARATLQTEEARLAAANPKEYQNVGVDVQLLRETIVGPSRDLLRLLMAASALVLLIACVNTANLFLARAAAKRREMRVREFLGANRWQLLRPVLAESAMVALTGGGLGLLTAWGIARVLAMKLENFPRAEEIGIDLRVVLLTLAVSTIAAFGPALFQKQTAKNALVVAEIALTLVLLICSGLLMRSFVAMRQVDLGYNPRGVILGFVAMPEDSDDPRGRVVALWRRVRGRLAAMPGVEAVATSTATPAGGVSAAFPVMPEGVAHPATNGSDASVVICSADYFRVSGIPVRAGRNFRDGDRAREVLVSQSIADRYFQGNAIGRRIFLPSFNFNVTQVKKADLREIVGVVGNVKQKSVNEAGRMTIYVPDGQDGVRYVTVMARVRSGDPMQMERGIRQAMFEEAPELTMAPMLTLDRGNAYLTRAPLRAMWLIGIFAGLALILATVGVHGVVSYATSQRGREMGIRMALGARPEQLFSLVTGQALRLAVIGAGVGAAAAYGCTKVLATLLFGVGRGDPATYILCAAILAAAAAIASVGPARRAARTDPAITLRAE